MGNIEDEHDSEEETEEIVSVKGQRYRVKALTSLERFNEYFGTLLSHTEANTVGEMVISLFGYIPKRGESQEYNSLRFTVLRADSRRLHTVLVEKLSTTSDH